jgi:hypothetical protein
MTVLSIGKCALAVKGPLRHISIFFGRPRLLLEDRSSSWVVSQTDGRTNEKARQGPGFS